MLSDDRLKQLIEYQNKWCAECEHDDTEHIPRDGLWDTHNALTELVNYRRTFAKIEEVLKADSSREIEFGLGYAVLTRDDSATNEAFVAQCDTPFAALSKLADSIIREELERKDSTP